MTEVLVVHCVDAEGPLGGDARRNTDDTPEFYDNWPDIMASLHDLTSRRYEYADSYGHPYHFEWFPLDFTGFRTNPKQRDTTPHAVYDRIRTLPMVWLDGIGFHHHCPPVSGVGDEWADRWDPAEANRQIRRRFEERGHRPRTFRAGGTIEDNALSGWLNRMFELDFSNRVSERSYPDAPLAEFNWFGAPARWGSYRPSADDFLTPGGMRRYIYRCIDLRSRYNEISDRHLVEAFTQAADEQRPSVLSFFSHDNRDMRPETKNVVRMIRRASERHGIPWRSCTALEAHLRHHL